RRGAVRDERSDVGVASGEPSFPPRLAMDRPRRRALWRVEAALPRARRLAGSRRHQARRSDLLCFAARYARAPWRASARPLRHPGLQRLPALVRAAPRAVRPRRRRERRGDRARQPLTGATLGVGLGLGALVVLLAARAPGREASQLAQLDHVI